MIYEKMPALFLSILAAEKTGSTNSSIAGYILAHREEAARMGITELAEKCHVGTGSVSRFCRDFGFHDFSELKRLLRAAEFRYEDTEDAGDTGERIETWSKRMCQLISRTADSLDPGKIRKLAEDIRKYERISAYGMLKAEGPAISLQTDLLMMKKHIRTVVPYTDQIEQILSASAKDLIIIFSFTGSYFEYHRFGEKEKKLYPPKIWMVCGTDQPLPGYIDDAVRFDSDQDQFSHPYQLQMAGSLIAAEYAALLKEENHG